MHAIAKKVVRYGVISAKSILRKNPRIKQLVKRVVYTQLGLSKAANHAYGTWLHEHSPDFIDTIRLREDLAGLHYRPLISLVLPTYNTDRQFLLDCLDSVKAQIYENWQLCIVDDASPDKQVRDIIEQYAQDDKRITYTFLAQNKHIANASNEAITLAKGEFIGLLDHDDVLLPNALLEVIRALNDDQTLDFLYTDEDKITENRHEHLGPFFKPDWNPDFLRSVNYITHFAVIRKTIIDAVGGLRETYNGAQDWDLFLRITRHTSRLRHIPKIVYSWRIHDLSTAKTTDAKPYVIEAQRMALYDDAKQRGYENAVIERDPEHGGYWRVHYPLLGKPLISIIIPSKNQYAVVLRCIRSIFAKTTYPNFEVILVDTGSTDKRVLRMYKSLQQQHANFTVVDWPDQPFSYSKACNKGAEVARGSLLMMLNNDTEVITPNWLEVMGGDAQRKEIGAVGCLLFYPDGYRIQHAGIGIGLGGTAANSFSMMTLDQLLTQTQHLMLNTKHNMTAVTAACMMIRKDLFQEIGGFDEKLRVTYNDVDLCLRIHAKGYHNLYTPYARLLHHESISVGSPDQLRKRDTVEFKAAKQLFQQRWSTYIAHDPNLNPNLSKDNAFYDV